MANKPKPVTRSYLPTRKAFDRDRVNEFDYNSRTWRNLRNRYINANPLCVKCEKNDLIVPANVVDHIIQVKLGGEPLDESNLQSLCKSCHNSKSALESKGNGVKSR